VRFDLSSLSGTVANATMRITTSNAALSSGTVDVYEVLEAWDEGTQVGAAGTANYGMRQSLAAWTSAGCGVGSRGGAPVAELQPLATNTQYELALPAALVQGWIQDPTTNHGVALLTANSGTSTVTFFARESAMPPELVVEIGP
jgi:hypothetical protein